MREGLCSSDVSPRIVRADRETQVTIRPPFGSGPVGEGAEARRACPTGAEYKVTICALSGLSRQGCGREPRRLRVRASGGALRLRHTFEAEQEHVVLVELVDDPGPLVAEFRLYSLEEDLYTRRPLKGDFHLHTSCSDGRESPAYVAGASRRIGMDLIAITDHRLYQPSLEAIQRFSGLPVDLRIYPGEEVHPPGCPVHIVNFGGRWSVNALFETPRYQAEVRDLEDNLPPLGTGVDRYQYAASLWTWERIREAQGLGIFCHPYWVNNHRYDVPEALTSAILSAQPYDALELIGGYHRFEAESNTLQVARYQEERAQGRTIPIVGASDAHGCERGELFGWYYSVVFARTTELEDIISSVKGLYSVAIEALPGETARAHGPLRLVRYALFLMREVLPQHDALCEEEGQLMLAYLAGDPHAFERLSACKGRVSRLYKRLWEEDAGR